ncbi:adrenocortical dysplasia protein homolog isoform X2 [Pelodiscus sinensis]|uniref:adrenocortical dysplasia protein homolog isoform X2 n=1 Tax=Pelodiscus sinensis TaxID=13735 RepID=UPI003F6AD95F
MREQDPPPGLPERHVSGLSVCYLPRAAIFQAKSPERSPEQAGMQRVEDERRQLSVPKVYVLQPWILNLLMKYRQSDSRETHVPGHILKVVSDLKATDPAPAAVLWISDGSYYVRAVVSPEAVRMADCAQLQTGFSSILGRIIILQKYTVCFQEETQAEACEFFLAVHRFVVLPLQRQKMESLNCNQEPSILQKIKELWQRGLTLKTVSSSGASVSQLMLDMGQHRLASLKQNVEECLDALDLGEVPATKWEAARKREQMSAAVFTVPARLLVIRPEEQATGGAPHTAPRSSRRDSGLDAPSMASYLSDPGATSRSLDASPDNPWDALQSVSVTVTSSLEEKSIAPPGTPETQPARSTEEAAVAQPDSNTPDFLEPCGQDSPCEASQGDPAGLGSPSLLSSSSSCPPGPALFQGAPDVDKPDTSLDIPCGQLPRVLQSSLCPLSPALPSVGGSGGHTAPPASGQASPPAAGTGCGLGSRAGGRDLSPSRKPLGTKRKLLLEDKKARDGRSPSPGKAPEPTQGDPPAADGPAGAGCCPGRGAVDQHPGMALPSVHRAKRSRLEWARPAGEPEPPGRGKETASARSVGVSGPGRPRAQQQYVKPSPLQYTYEGPPPDLCARVGSTRISKAMRRWACWVITRAEQP